jgi:hypothetical protein
VVAARTAASGTVPESTSPACRTNASMLTSAPTRTYSVVVPSETTAGSKTVGIGPSVSTRSNESPAADTAPDEDGHARERDAVPDEDGRSAPG